MLDRESSSRLLHVSDLHFGIEEDRALVEEFLNFVTKLPSPDVIIASGDFCFNGEATSLRRAKDFLLELGQKLRVEADRIFAVPGNHDCNRFRSWISASWSKRAFFRELGRFARLNEPIFLPDINLTLYLLDSNNFRLRERLAGVVLGGLSRFLAGGKVGKAKIAQLAESFRTDPKENDPETIFDSRRRLNSFKVAVVHHHPLPIPIVGEDLLAVVLDSGDLLCELTAADFDVLLHGHQHYPIQVEVTYWPQWQSGDGNALLISGAGTLSKAETAHTRSPQFEVLEFDASDQRKIRVAIHSFSHIYGRWQDSGRSRVFTREKHNRESFVMAPRTLDVIARSVGYKRTYNEVSTLVRRDGSARTEIHSRCEAMISSLKQIHLHIKSEADSSKAFSFIPISETCQKMVAGEATDEHGYLYINCENCLSKGDIAEFRLEIDSPAGSFKWSARELPANRETTRVSELPRNSIKDREFVGHIVAIPTDELRLILQFERGLPATPEIHVLVGDDGDEHRTATRTVRERIVRTESRWSVTVPYPIFGASYIWSWQVD